MSKIVDNLVETNLSETAEGLRCIKRDIKYLKAELERLRKKEKSNYEAVKQAFEAVRKGYPTGLNDIENRMRAYLEGLK